MCVDGKHNDLKNRKTQMLSVYSEKCPWLKRTLSRKNLVDGSRLIPSSPLDSLLVQR